MSVNLPTIGNKSKRSNSFTDTQPAVKMLRESLHIQTDKQMNMQISSILQDAQIIVNNKQLSESIFKLRELGLLKNYEARIMKQQGFKKKEYVLNDYHTKSTTNGYSRNYGGLFYNR